MTLGVACGKLQTMIARRHEHDAPSLGLVLVDALVFWLRHQAVFWLMALPIAGLAAAITYILEANQALVDWRHHWGWDFLFALIYAMFLDRWIKEALLEDARPGDEVDALRRSTIALRFLLFAAALGLMATALARLPHVELAAVLWTAAAALFALMLPVAGGRRTLVAAPGLCPGAAAADPSLPADRRRRRALAGRRLRAGVDCRTSARQTVERRRHRRRPSAGRWSCCSPS